MRITAIMWDYDSIGNEIIMKMMLIDGIKEPTLTQIQENEDDENVAQRPAWLYLSERHPGIPEHYHTISAYNSTSYSQIDNLQLPQLPFSLVNHETKYKLLIALKARELELPSLNKLSNGSIVITSSNFPMVIEKETEIFLDFHNKLLPCFYTNALDEVIIESPATIGCRVRCYYLVIPSVITEVTFIDLNGNVLHRCEYDEIWLHGSTSYHQISKALKEST